MENIVLIGAGGHCKVIIDIIKSTSSFEIYGITDYAKLKGERVLGFPILGTDDELRNIYKSGVKNAFICVGSVGNGEIRDRIYSLLKVIGFNIPVLIHKSAVVSPYASIGSGTCVMPGAVINSGAVIGENCIINTSSIVEHDCTIGRNSHISPGACVAGGVKVGEGSHIGLGASIIQGVTIGNGVIIGAGSVVIDGIRDNVTAVGVPAKIIKCR
jgi:UDP-perosamine 4-acetyltransferase